MIHCFLFFSLSYDAWLLSLPEDQPVELITDLEIVKFIRESVKGGPAYIGSKLATVSKNIFDLSLRFFKKHNLLCFRETLIQVNQEHFYVSLMSTTFMVILNNYEYSLIFQGEKLSIF